MNEVNIMIH